MRSARILGIAPAIAVVALFSACEKVGIDTGGTTTVETNWGHPARHALPPDDRRHAQAADPIFLTTLTPTAAFRGNQTALVGNALGTSSSLVTAVLVRQADCSLTLQASSFTTAGAVAAPPVATLPNADAYIHALASATTTAGVFADGCADSALGASSAPGAYLGKASNGDLLIAAPTDAGVQLPLRLLTLSAQGTTAGPTPIAADAAQTVAAADFNGDAIADIVTPFTSASGQSGVGVFLSSNGAFGAPTIYGGYPPGVTKTSATVAIEDVDGDLDLDIVALGQEPFQIAPGRLFTLLGNGNGTFTAGPSGVNVGSSGAFVLGDFDGDDDPDALVAAGGWFAHGNGDGSFAAPQQRLTAYSALRQLAAADFDGDGNLDVAATIGANPPNEARFVGIFRGNGDGTFAPGPTYAATRAAESVGTTDVDGDGNVDVVVGIVQPGVIAPGLTTFTIMHFLLGRGDGTFIAAEVLPGAGVPSGLVTAYAPTFALADFNGDTFPDLVTASQRASQNVPQPSALVLRAGSANATFGAPSAAVTLPLTPQHVTAADLDADGRLDLIALGTAPNGAPAVSTAFGQAGGTFAAALPYPLTGSANTFLLDRLAAGDTNGDGRADVIVRIAADSTSAPALANSGTFVLLANSNGTLNAATKIDAVTKRGPLAVADFNGDARADVAIADVGQFTVDTITSLRIYTGNANGTFAGLSPLTPAVYYHSLATGDLDGDGKLDLVIGGNDSALAAVVLVLRGNGDATFMTPTTFAVADGFAESSFALAVADFTADGDADVLVGRSQRTAVLTGAGDGTLAIENSLIIGGQADYLQAADLDQDSVVDAVAAVHLLGIVPLVREPQAVPASSTPPTPPPTPPPPPPPPSPDFAVSAASGALTTAAGQTASTSITVTPSDGFSAPVALSCSGLPQGAACTFAPATVTLAGNAASSTLSIATDGGAVAAALPPRDSTSPGWLYAVAAFAFLGTRRGTRRFRGARLLFAVAASIALLSGVAACHSSSGSSPNPPPAAPPAPPAPPLATGTPAGTATVTITATSGSGGGALVHTTTLSLTVTR